MRFTMEVDLNHAAFRDDLEHASHYDLIELVEHVAEQLRRGMPGQPICTPDGVTVGSWEIELEEVEE